MTLTIPSIALYGAPVLNSASEAALRRGVIHMPDTSFPWSGGTGKNVYLAGHRLGYPNTGSRLIFYHLPELTKGDTVRLGRGDQNYRYRVSKKIVVDPGDMWVTLPVQGKDMVSLQTCVGPEYGKRLIVRAERVE
jgi:sortase A